MLVAGESGSHLNVVPRPVGVVAGPAGHRGRDTARATSLDNLDLLRRGSRAARAFRFGRLGYTLRKDVERVGKRHAPSRRHARGGAECPAGARVRGCAARERTANRARGLRPGGPEAGPEEEVAVGQVRNPRAEEDSAVDRAAPLDGGADQLDPSGRTFSGVHEPVRGDQVVSRPSTKRWPPWAASRRRTRTPPLVG